MLDELLGRATLKERVDDLEAEVERLREERASLEDRLEAERRRRSEAVSDRQAAEEEVNRLEDRIAGLEGTVERLREREGADDGRTFRDREELDRRAAERVLERLRSVSAPPDAACTAVVTDAVPDDAREAFGDRAALVERAAPCVALTDEHGLVSVALRPPVLPEPGVTWAESFALEREHVLPTGSFAFALVRSDTFAIGEYRGDERRSVEGFESDVKGDHSKGGFSQGRFERRRDAQVEEHLADCREVIEARDADVLYLAGHRDALEALDVDARATAAVDATGKPEAALDAAFEDFWTTQLFLL